jgi:hypothetical protein
MSQKKFRITKSRNEINYIREGEFCRDFFPKQPAAVGLGQFRSIDHQCDLRHLNDFKSKDRLHKAVLIHVAGFFEQKVSKRSGI